MRIFFPFAIVMLSGCGYAFAEAAYIGPYINHATPTSVKILWVASTNWKGDCPVVAKDAAEPGPIKVDIQPAEIPGRKERLYTATVTGLKPGQHYRYTLQSGGDRVEGSFRPPPLPGTKGPMKFIFYGDNRSEVERHKSVIDGMVKELPFDFCCNTGDLVSDGLEWSQWKHQFFDPAAEVLRQSVIWPARGNHEEDGVLLRALFDLPGNELYYSFDAGDLHVSVLDSEQQFDPAEEKVMLEWLDRDLAATRAPWKFVMYHEPTFNMGGHATKYARDELVPILEKYGVDMVFTGHSHLYERLKPIGPKGKKPVIYVVTGGGGAPSYKAREGELVAYTLSALHYCALTLNGNRLEMSVKTPDGKEIDRLTLDKTPEQIFTADVMREAVTTEFAVLQTCSAFNSLLVDYTEMPKAKTPTVGLTALKAFPLYPAGCQVEISPATESNGWTVKPTSFTADGKPHPIELTPPTAPGLVALGRFDPAPKVRLKLSYGETSRVEDNVPVFLTNETLIKLMPNPPSAGIPFTATDIKVDGNLDEWKGVPFPTLPSTGKPGQTLRLCWNDSGIYGALDTKDEQIAPNMRRPLQGDHVSIEFETNGMRSNSTYRNKQSSWLSLFPTEEASGGRSGITISYGRYLKNDIPAVWKKTNGGYVIEFHIPTRVMAPVPMKEGSRFTFNYFVRNGKKTVEEFIDTSKIGTIERTPVFWGVLTLNR